MRILGLDTATQKLGFAVLEKTEAGLAYVDCGVLHAPAHWPRWKRLRELHSDLGQLIAECRPDRAAIEGGVDKYPRAALAGGESRGIALAALFSAGLTDEEIGEYSPAAVKRAATGSGKAPKTVVARMVTVRFGLARQPDEDAADALAIALAAFGGVATVPKRKSRRR